MRSSLDARNAGTVAIGDVRVARLGFGARPLAGPTIWPRRRPEARGVLRRVVELGINFIDTANIYGAGVSEVQIADALFPYPSDLIIATKAGMAPREANGDLGIDGHPDRIMKRCDESRERLSVDCLDLFQLHIPDPKVPFEEQIGAFRELRDRGKIRRVGVCNVTLDQLRRAQRIVDIVSVQNGYNVSSRGDEDVLRYCEDQGIAFIAHRPLGNGAVAESRGLAEVARVRGVTPHVIALAWLLQRSPSLMTIPGTASLLHLEENVGAAAIALSPEELHVLAESAES
jgi:pyridoxine 4-dehydrogenase